MTPNIPALDMIQMNEDMSRHVASLLVGPLLAGFDTMAQLGRVRAVKFADAGDYEKSTVFMQDTIALNIAKDACMVNGFAGLEAARNRVRELFVTAPGTPDDERFMVSDMGSALAMAHCFEHLAEVIKRIVVIPVAESLADEYERDGHDADEIRTALVHMRRNDATWQASVNNQEREYHITKLFAEIGGRFADPEDEAEA